MPAQRLGGIAVFGLLLAGCAQSSAAVAPPNYAQPPYGQPPGAPPMVEPGAPAPSSPEAQRLVVTPVFYVPADVYLDPQTEAQMTQLIAGHLALAQQRYQKMLVVDTFQWAIEQPITYHSPLTADQLEMARPDTAHEMTRELLAWRREDRNGSRHVFVALLVRAPGRPCRGRSYPRCLGGARTFNGSPGTGGGFVQMEAANLLDGIHFQSTLIHELGHAFGLSHADCHGESMHEGMSIMSYNTRHWSYGFNESAEPGVFTAEDLVTLARNRLAFPRLAADPRIADLARRPLMGASGECDLGPMDATIGPLQRPGYQLYYNGRQVNGPDAQFYTRKAAQDHCAAIVRAHPEIRVRCAYDNVVIGGNAP